MPVPQINAIFWDVGGVMLTNAWDRSQRERALEQLNQDRAEYVAATRTVCARVVLSVVRRRPQHLQKRRHSCPLRRWSEAG